MAATCEHCQQSLFDYVYGLLEANELREVSEHLNGCSCCRAALEKVQAQQQLLGCAARAVTVVPEFSVPQDDHEKLPQAPSSAAEAPAALPLAPVPVPRRPFWRRPWVAWATAAALFLTISAAISY